MKKHEKTQNHRSLEDESAIQEKLQPDWVQSDLPLRSQSIAAQGDGKSFSANRVLGVDELAVLFGCSTEKIKRRARNRELPAFKFGKSWYVREQDLERYIEQAVELNLRLDRNLR
jgi:excisionase family DNA binding protein